MVVFFKWLCATRLRIDLGISNILNTNLMIRRYSAFTQFCCYSKVPFAFLYLQEPPHFNSELCLFALTKVHRGRQSPNTFTDFMNTCCRERWWKTHIYNCCKSLISLVTAVDRWTNSNGDFWPCSVTWFQLPPFRLHQTGSPAVDIQTNIPLAWGHPTAQISCPM